MSNWICFLVYGYTASNAKLVNVIPKAPFIHCTMYCILYFPCTNNIALCCNMSCFLNSFCLKYIKEKGMKCPFEIMNHLGMICLYVHSEMLQHYSEGFQISNKNPKLMHGWIKYVRKG